MNHFRFSNVHCTTGAQNRNWTLSIILSKYAAVLRAYAARNVQDIRHVATCEHSSSTMESVIFENSPIAHYLEGESLWLSSALCGWNETRPRRVQPRLPFDQDGQRAHITGGSHNLCTTGSTKPTPEVAGKALTNTRSEDSSSNGRRGPHSHHLLGKT